jgi:hypothetical protein|tara:strand:+ start:248 stop:451 length:204 start_codon:yes stop_codon:yes gene_type:complete
MGEAATETQADEEDSPLLGADTNSAVNATDDAAPVGITGLGLSSAPLSALASGRSSRRYSSVTTADY